MRLANKIGIVTAAASGMGRAGAIRFAKEGAAIGVVDIDRPASKPWSPRSRKPAGKRKGIVADLTQGRGFQAHRHARPPSTFGGLDFVWNHVGHPGPGGDRRPRHEGLRSGDTLNLRTVLVTTEAALPELRARGGGSLLYTASTSGLHGSQFSPVYSAVKHGVVGLVRASPSATRKEKIRVNAICPGPIDTPMLRVFVARPDQQSTLGMDKEELVRTRGGQTPWAVPARRRRWPTRRCSCCRTKPRS